MKFLIFLLLLLEIGIAHALPSCAFQKFDFSMNDIGSSLTVSPPGRNDDLFIVNVKARSDDDYTGRLLIFDNQCDLKYIQKLEYYPLSVFILDDGISDIVFNLMQSGDGTYMLDAYYLSSTDATRVIVEAASNPFRPMFTNDPNTSAPIVKTYNRFSGICEIYKFNKSQKQYTKTKSNKTCKFSNSKYCC